MPKHGFRPFAPFAALLAGLSVIAVGLTVAATADTPAAPPCDHRDLAGAPYTVCPFDPATQDLRLVWRGRDGRALRRFPALQRDLGPDAARVAFAMNAGMYETDGRPLGLFIEAGAEGRALNTRTGASGNFYMAPNGVFSVAPDGTPRIESTEAYRARDGAPRWATQSGPMLLIAGRLHPGIQPDGASHYIRNGACVAPGGRLFFVISETKVSFGRFATAMRDGLACTDALYFDGAVSSLWAPALRRMDDRYALGPMVVVLVK